MTFKISTMWGNHHLYLVPDQLDYPERRPCTNEAVVPHTLLLPAPNLHSVSSDVPSLGISFERNHAFWDLAFSYFSSVAQSCLTLCNPMDCSMPGFPVHHQLLELAQTHVQWLGDANQPSHPLSSPSSPAFNLSQHQVLFQWVFFTSGGQSIGLRVSASASVFPMNIQDWFPLGLTGLISLLCSST